MRLGRGWNAGRWLMVLITLAAFGLRLWQLDQVPPGWSDDELSNVLVIAQKPLQGDYSVYYTDATGLEALYHAVSAIPLVLFGYNALGIRLLSAVLGTLTVPLTYRLARRLTGSELVAVTAAAALAVSFWSLIYSRINLRHISLPVLMLPAFYCFWSIWRSQDRSVWRSPAVPAGLLLGLSFYTYFASRGLPLILLAACLYAAVFYRPVLRRHLREVVLMFVLAALVALPLVITVASQSGADARVAEVAIPLVRAREGDWSVLREHVVRTLSMFHADGDDEFLYNIPGRPVFSLLWGIVFWSGLAVAVWYAVVVPLRRGHGRSFSFPAAFLLLWWLAGITPGFLSVPPASLGHTIVAQPATYILLALPLLLLQRLPRPVWMGPALAILLVLGVAARDLPDYFQDWPRQGNTRFLYRADLQDVARYLEQRPELADFAISGLLAGAGPWDRLALELEVNEHVPHAIQPRWYNPQRAVILALNGEPAVAFMGYPAVEMLYEELYQPVPGETAGGYQLAEINNLPPQSMPTCFENGLCLAGSSDPAGGYVDLYWGVARPLSLPEMPLVSKPPPPGVYDGPRLYVFAQLVDENGALLVGDDGLWVDPVTLRPGDVFVQRHLLPVPAGSTPQALLLGLYDPFTGERVRLENGRDHMRLELNSPDGPQSSSFLRPYRCPVACSRLG